MNEPFLRHVSGMTGGERGNATDVRILHLIFASTFYKELDMIFVLNSIQDMNLVPEGLKRKIDSRGKKTFSSQLKF